ncbi:hypothetical protein V6N13_142993 [Hibiscus sabdariffa]|uniref:Uncharacterized protein n=1 Tax=Hibiscus sabdariffa TaxID=183260 RepID=A0ABR2FFW5_9ROSI
MHRLGYLGGCRRRKAKTLLLFVASHQIYYLSPDSVFLALFLVVSFPSHCWLSSSAFIHVHIHGNCWWHCDLARFPFESCCLCVRC